MLDYFTIIQLKYTNKLCKEKISNLKLDTILDLRNIKIVNENNTVYKILKYHKQLKKVIIEFRKINDTHILQINQDLEYINLNGCHNITDKSLIYLSQKCKNLKRLELYWVPNITDLGLIEILNNCKNLVELNISGLKHVTYDALKLIPKNLKKLESLNLTRCVGVTDEFLIDLVENLNLKYLNLYALPYLQCNFLTNLASKGKNCNIEFLDLCGNTTMEDISFTQFKDTDGLRNLKYLNLSWCGKITDASFEAIYNQLDNLELLSLHGLLGITDKTIDLLNQNTGLKQNLHTLDLSGCLKIKNRDHQFLLEKFPKIICFKYHF